MTLQCMMPIVLRICWILICLRCNDDFLLSFHFSPEQKWKQKQKKYDLCNLHKLQYHKPYFLFVFGCSRHLKILLKNSRVRALRWNPALLLMIALPSTTKTFWMMFLKMIAGPWTRTIVQYVILNYYSPLCFALSSCGVKIVDLFVFFSTIYIQSFYSAYLFID